MKEQMAQDLADLVSELGRHSAGSGRLEQSVEKPLPPDEDMQKLPDPEGNGVNESDLTVAKDARSERTSSSRWL